MIFIIVDLIFRFVRFYADGCIATAISTLHSLGVVSNFCLGFVLHFKCGLIYLAILKHERYFFAV